MRNFLLNNKQSRWLISVIGLLVLVCELANAEEARKVYLPLTFFAEARTLQTSACLQVTEHTYQDRQWWERATLSTKTPEESFKGVIAAIRKKDHQSLLDLSHPTLGRDPELFDRQANALFQQFEKVQLVSVSRSFTFDGIAVFFAKFNLEGRSFFVPLSFAVDTSGGYKFLPYRTEIVTYTLVNDWFNSPWGPTETESPSYCTEKIIKKFTHKISLIALQKPNDKADASVLFLSGMPIINGKSLKGIVKQVMYAIETMKSTDLSKVKGIDDFLKHLSLEGANRLKDWFATATQPERDRYKSELVDIEPFYVFDARPLVIIYGKTKNSVQSMHFTANENNELLWTNSSHITVMDKVFKSGYLYDAALLDKPFSEIKIKN